MKKVAHYRRAVWVLPTERTLFDVLSACVGRIASRTLHVFEYTDTLLCLTARFSPRRPIDALFLQFVVYERGAGAAIIPTVIRAAQADAGEAAPPAGSEYILSQIFCRVQGNHVVWMTHNSALRDASIYDVFAKFIESLPDADAEDEDVAATGFQFRAILDREAYERAFTQGIEEIDLGLGDFQSTLEALTDRNTLPRPGFLSSMTSLVRRRPTREEIRAAALVEARISLRPGRDWNKPHVTSLLAKVAENVMNSTDDEFAIVTKDGFRLTRDKMSVHKEYRVDGNSRVLNSNDVEAALALMFTQLEQSLVIDDNA